MMHNYDFKTGKIEDEKVIKSMNRAQIREYMALLQWFDDNPMKPISVSDIVFGKRER